MYVYIKHHWCFVLKASASTLMLACAFATWAWINRSITRLATICNCVMVWCPDVPNGRRTARKEMGALQVACART